MGLLVWFAVVVFTVVAEGMREMRFIIKDEQGELSQQEGEGQGEDG
ncbi:MAG: hypothetical protein KAR83_02505 [Thermodesulfovibrionales bacterium]|nr:hypothetical protein [Thermodesulfovibrionales bacterium]